jgi:predicted aldo/keto reductase-like oxidoreductase
MTKHNKCWSRRNFLKTVGAAGVGSMISPLISSSNASSNALRLATNLKTVPTRPFGKTGVNVSILSLGGSVDFQNSLLLLKQAVRWGITYWDTAHSYGGGSSEKGIGKYFGKYPEDRNKIFLVTKSWAWTLKEMTRQLNQSLERMKTDYIDLFFVHGINHIDDIDDETKRWTERAKSEGKIRFFGFSTHSNMAECLLDASRIGWIDGIMMTYNYRLMHTDRMRAAVDACAKAGIGLTAMKTQGGGAVKTNSDTEIELAGRFLKKGFTDGQAKLKAIWENPQIASICSEIPNLTLLMSNTAAAMNNTKLSAVDMKLLKQYADETCSDYCAGCTHVCESTLADPIPIGDIMRYLMYSRSYGDHERAVAAYRKLPAGIPQKLSTTDFSTAEKRCPQKMAISTLMREAARKLK